MKKAIMLICILISVKAFSQNSIYSIMPPHITLQSDQNKAIGVNAGNQIVEYIQTNGDSITIPANIKFLVIDGQVYEIKRGNYILFTTKLTN